MLESNFLTTFNVQRDDISSVGVSHRIQNCKTWLRLELHNGEHVLMICSVVLNRVSTGS